MVKELLKAAAVAAVTCLVLQKLGYCGVGPNTPASFQPTPKSN